MLSNHIGANVLGISRDGYAICWIQNTRAQHNNEEIVPTGAGSMDWTDLLDVRKNGPSDFIRLIAYAMGRELAEESSFGKLTKSDLLHLAKSVKVIGSFRWLMRGAKPEFIGLVKLTRSAQEFMADQREVERVDRFGRILQFFPFRDKKTAIEFCDAIESSDENPPSLPLWVISKRIRELVSVNMLNEFF
ncbi:MAG: hypothetical protein SynsKO_43040 [Synoicihabitans sp.]